MRFQIVVFHIVFISLACFASADTVQFINGDQLSGKITAIEDGKIKLHSDIAGDVTADMAKVKTFSTDGPLAIRKTDSSQIQQQIIAGDTGQVKLADGTTLAIADISRTPPPLGKWTGFVKAGGEMDRGNTHAESLNVAAHAELRRQDDLHNDLTLFDGSYLFARQRDEEGTLGTTTDSWMATAKYQYYFTPKFYEYDLMKAEHDRVADLYYRLSPGVGVGYQWIDRSDEHFTTEAGISYVFEKYDNDGNNDFFANRLAYHFDKKLNDKVSFFHDLEWLPSIIDPGDYNLNTDAGIHVDLRKNLFAEFKIQLQRDSRPAPGALKNDIQGITSLGWSF